MHGHLMGAGGAVEFVISMLAIKNKAIPAYCKPDYTRSGVRFSIMSPMKGGQAKKSGHHVDSFCLRRD